MRRASHRVSRKPRGHRCATAVLAVWAASLGAASAQPPDAGTARTNSARTPAPSASTVVRPAEGDTAGAIRGRPATGATVVRVSRLGALSGDEENANNDADPVFRPQVVALNWSTNVSAPSNAPIPVAQHARSQEIMEEVIETMKDREINVALLGQHKYMVNDCLGLKVSAGEFSMGLANPTFGFEDTSIVLRFTIDSVSMTALKVRMRPSASVNPCTFGGRFELGGSASDVRIEYRYDPTIDVEHCRLADTWFPRVVVRIGALNLKPLQNDLDRVAKEMIEDAVSWSLQAPVNQTGISAIAATIINEITRAMERALTVDCPGEQLPEPVRDTVELASMYATAGAPPASAERDTTVGALEQRIADLERQLAAVQSQRTGETRPAAEPAAGPPPPAANASSVQQPPSPGVAAAYVIEANAALQGRLGRLVVRFPAPASNTRVAVYSANGPDKEIQGAYGNLVADLLPGTYVVAIGNKRVAAVPVESRSDTRMRVGVLSVGAGSSTRVAILGEDEKELVGGYGNSTFGLPVGTVKVSVAGQTEQVEIREGEVTNF